MSRSIDAQKIKTPVENPFLLPYQPLSFEPFLDGAAGRFGEVCGKNVA
jgi:hypothetical protein